MPEYQPIEPLEPMNNNPSGKSRVKFFLCFIFLAVTCTRSEAGTSVPDLAQICGVRIGYDTMDALEHRVGRGLPEMGGHSHSGREWLSHGADCDISADAFWYYDEQGHADGAVIDSLSITPLSHDRVFLEETGEDTLLPVAHLAPQKVRFMNIVSLGMNRRDVLRALVSKLPKPDIQDSSLVWTVPGYVRVRNNIVMTSWSAELKFDHDKLDEIRIESSIDRQKAGLDLATAGKNFLTPQSKTGNSK